MVQQPLAQGADAPRCRDRDRFIALALAGCNRNGAEAPRGVRVAQDAIVQRDGADVAFVVGEDDTVEQRTLALGRAMATERQVLSGLAPGEIVVLDPPVELSDGGTVVLAEAGND